MSGPRRLPCCSLYSAVAPQHGLQQEFEDSPREREDTTQPSSRHCISDATAFNSYTALYSASLIPGVPLGMRSNSWLVVDPCPQLETLLQPLSYQAFGYTTFDFEMLCAALSWDVPAGIAVINVPRMRCIVCKPGRQATASMIDSTLSWMRREGTLGIVILPGSSLAFLHVFFNPFQARVSNDARCAQLYEAFAFGFGGWSQ